MLVITFLLGGRRYDIYFISEGRGVLKDFADAIRAQGPLADVIREDDALEEKNPHPKDWKKFIKQAEKLSENPISVMSKTAMVKQWSKQVDEEKIVVSELRPGQIRVIFFEDEHGDHDTPRIILTHGFLKKGDQTPDSEIDCFLDHRARYYTWLFRDS